MYHRSVPLSHSRLPRQPLRGLSSVQNENALNSNHNNIKNVSIAASTPTKPQQHTNTGRTRRALGDISNSKGPKSSSAKAGSNIPTVKKQQAGILTPRTQIPRLTTRTTTTNKKATILPSKLNPPSHTSQQKSSSSSLLPSRTTAKREPAKLLQQAPVPISKAVSSTRPAPAKLEPVPDVELPAGRTYLQQQLNNDFRDDDEWSTSTFGSSGFNEATMWDDWSESLRQQEQEQRQKEDEEVQAHIEKVLKEQDQGLECLLDFVDNLDLDDDSHGLEAESDNWSEPASSMLGNVYDNDDSLLFEI